MIYFRDLLEILAMPHGVRIFMRRDYDKFGPQMRRMAGMYRRLLLRRTRLVAVIGSLGKTSTRAAVNAALDCPDRHFSFSNYGSSLAENLLRVKRRDRHAVLEVGIAGPGPMAGNARMIAPDIVIVTSIKSDHNRSFPTLFDTRAEKVKMVSSLPESALAVLNGDDPHVRWMAGQTVARTVTFGFDAGNDYRAVNYRSDAAGRVRFDVALDDRLVTIEADLRGRHMVYPLLAAVVVAHLEGLDQAEVAARLAALRPAVGRLDPLLTPAGVQIFDDSCKASLESIHAAFDMFGAVEARRKFVVIGKIEEPTGNVREAYRDLGRRLAEIADVVVSIGDEYATTMRAEAVRAGMDRSAFHLHGSRIEGAADYLSVRLESGDAVLVKGAGAHHLGRVALQLQGRHVACPAQLCNVKVASCGECPLLEAARPAFENHYVRRYIKALAPAE